MARKKQSKPRLSKQQLKKQNISKRYRLEDLENLLGTSSTKLMIEFIGEGQFEAFVSNKITLGELKPLPGYSF